MECRYQLQLTDPTIDYQIDHVYLFPESILRNVLNWSNLNMNNGFELRQNSIYKELDGWNPLFAKGNLILSNEAPEGYQYLEVVDRQKDRIIEQALILPENFNSDTLIEIRFWAKFRYNDENIPEGREATWNKFYTKFRVDYITDGKPEKFGFRVS